MKTEKEKEKKPCVHCKKDSFTETQICPDCFNKIQGITVKQKKKKKVNKK